MTQRSGMGARLAKQAEHTDIKDPMAEASTAMPVTGGGVVTGGRSASEPPPAVQVSHRKAKRSPQKARKLLVSPDSNGENWSYGDPRVEPLSQLSDLVALEEPPRRDDSR